MMETQTPPGRRANKKETSLFRQVKKKDVKLPVEKKTQEGLDERTKKGKKGGSRNGTQKKKKKKKRKRGKHLKGRDESIRCSQSNKRTPTHNAKGGKEPNLLKKQNAHQVKGKSENNLTEATFPCHISTRNV